MEVGLGRRRRWRRRRRRALILRSKRHKVRLLEGGRKRSCYFRTSRWWRVVEGRRGGAQRLPFSVSVEVRVEVALVEAAVTVEVAVIVPVVVGEVASPVLEAPVEATRVVVVESAPASPAAEESSAAGSVSTEVITLVRGSVVLAFVVTRGPAVAVAVLARCATLALFGVLVWSWQKDLARVELLILRLKANIKMKLNDRPKS